MIDVKFERLFFSKIKQRELILWQYSEFRRTKTIETTMEKIYNYDYVNMMTSVGVTLNGISDEGQPNENTWSDTASDTYIYNGDGQRVKKVEANYTTKYYYTGSVILYIASDTNNKISGNNRPQAERSLPPVTAKTEETARIITSCITTSGAV